MPLFCALAAVPAIASAAKDYVLVFDFEKDKKKFRFFVDKHESDGFKVIRQGQSVSYMVVNMNPFKYEVIGKNSFAKKEDPKFEGDALKLLQAKLQPVVAEAPAGGAGDEEAKASAQSLKGLLQNLQKDGARPFVAKTQVDMKDAIKVLDDVSNLTQLDTVMPRVRSIARDARRDVEKFTEFAKEYDPVVRALELELERATASIERNKQFDKLQATLVTVKDKLDTYLAASKKAADLGASWERMKRISRDEDPSGTDMIADPGYGTSERTLRVIYNMKTAASKYREDLLKADTASRASDIPAALEAALAKSQAAYNDFTKSLEELDPKALKAINEAISSSREKKVGQEALANDRDVQRAKLDPKNDADRFTVLTLEANSYRLEAGNYEAHAIKLLGLATKVGEYKKKAEDAKTELASKEKELKDRVSAAEKRYHEIQATDFTESISQAATFSKASGTVTYTVTINEIAEDGTKKDITPKDPAPEYVFETNDDRNRTPFVTPAYIFAVPAHGNRSFTTVADPGGRRIIEQPREEADTGLAILAHIPTNPRAQRIVTTYTFGAKTDGSGYFLGISYLLGRDKGGVVTAGLSYTRVTRLDNQGVGDVIASENDLRTKDVLRNGFFVAIGFRF